MCEVCRSIPCKSACPNATEPQVMGHCRMCKSELRSDCTYYEDDEGDKFCCKDCACDYHKIEEKDW